MARKQTVEIRCERCIRVETITLNHPDVVEGYEAAFTGSFFGQKVSFADLCSPCTKAVRSHFEQIGKKLAGLSPDRPARSPAPVSGDLVDTVSSRDSGPSPDIDPDTES